MRVAVGGQLKKQLEAQTREKEALEQELKRLQQLQREVDELRTAGRETAVLEQELTRLKDHARRRSMQVRESQMLAMQLSSSVKRAG